MAQSRGGPLTRTDWLLAGQDLLRAGGVDAVRLIALTERVGATSGSFYHHFRDMDEYLDALARLYGDEQADAGAKLFATPAGGAERLRESMNASRGGRLRQLDRAMREWAASNPVARASVRKTDEKVLRVFEDAFDDMGFSRQQARLRARLLWAMVVARIYVPWERSDNDADEVIKLMLANTDVGAVDGSVASP